MGDWPDMEDVKPNDFMEHKPCEVIIERAEEILREAKNGNISNLAVVFDYKDDSSMRFIYVGEGTCTLVLGMIDRLREDIHAFIGEYTNSDPDNDDEG